MKWKIKKKIAEGSFSNVYKVEHKQTKEIAALKIIHQALYLKKEKRRFKRSFIATSKISNSNCVKMIEWIEDKDKIGFVMEYIDGKPISSLKTNKKELNLNKIISIIIQICNGLNALHSHNLIHRDLKPSNILITKDNEIKITDFDLVKIVDTFDTTVKGTFLGTVKYSSPEQCVNSSNIDQRSDLYSLGIIFYELITGKVPYDVKSFADLALCHIQSELISPKKLVHDLPLSIEKIIKKLLMKKPKDRYNSTIELINDLEVIMNNEEKIFENKSKYLFQNSFIGREKQLKFLESKYKEVLKGKSNTIIIKGESGIGKTKLLEEFKLNLKLQQVPVIDVCCVENGEVFDPLKAVTLRIIDSFAYIPLLKKIKMLGKFGWDITRIAPELKQLDIVGIIEKIPSLKGEESEIRLFEAITNLIKNFIAQAYSELNNKKFPGIVIYFDDFQLAEEPIYRWLLYAARNFKNTHILIIASTQNKSTNQILKKTIVELEKDKLTEIIDLKPFEKKDVKKMLTSLVSNKVDNNIVNLINKQTGGNPLFIREIIYHLYDTKKLILEKDRIYFDKQAIAEFKIDLVKKIIITRLNSLNPKINCLLQAAAVVGQSFNTVVLKHILNYEETVIMNYLEISRKLNLVKYEEKSDKYKFSYNKIRETLLTEVKDTNKKKYHKTIAEILENDLKNATISNEEGIIDRLAYHFYSAGIKDKIIKYCSLAGDNARNRYANKKALSLYQKVIDIVENETLLIDISLKQGNIYQLIGKWDFAERIFKKSLALSKKINNKYYISMSYKYLSLFLYNKGDYEDSMKYCNLTLKLLDKNDKDIVIIYRNIGNNYYRQAKYSESMNFLNKSLKIAENYNNKSEISKSLSAIGDIYRRTGKYSEAMNFYNKALKISEFLCDKRGFAQAKANIGIVYYFQNNLNKALELYEEFLNISEELGDKKRISSALGNIGIIYKKQHKYSKAMEFYKKRLKIAKAIGDKNGILQTIGNIGNIYFDKRNFVKAIEFLKKQLKLSKEINDKDQLVVTLENIGYIYKGLGEYKNALKYYNKKLVMCKNSNNVTELSYVYYALSIVYMETKKNKSAIKYINMAINITVKENIKDYLYEYIFTKANILYILKKYNKAKYLIDNLDINYKTSKELNFKIQILNFQTNYRLEKNQNKKKEIIYKLNKILQKEKKIKNKAEIFFKIWELLQKETD